MKDNRMKNVLENIARRGVPENTNLMPQIAAKLERKSPMTTLRTRPFAAILIALFILLTLSGVAYALGKTFGYIPGVGLVDNTSGIRMLAEPSAVTRDGIIVTVTQALVYNDHVELTYTVNGITESYDTGSDMCGSNHPANDFWSDSDADIRLPDGTVVRRDYAGKYQSQNIFAMKPVYAVEVPADVTEMTMLLKCIPFTKIGSAPENWKVPFQLVAVPAGTVIGAPVMEVNATSAPVTIEPAVTQSAPAKTAVAQPAPKLIFSLEHVVPTADGPIFYLHVRVENPDPALLVAFPRDVYVVDALGKKIQYMNNTPYSVDPATIWEYFPTEKPAAGALTLVVNDAVVKFFPAPSPAFHFDAGENPQYNQTWNLNQELEIAGYRIKIESARAATFDDIKDNPDIWDPNGGPDYPDGSQGYDTGYQFTVSYDVPVSNVALDIQSDSCWLYDARPAAPIATMFYTELCRGGYPKGIVNVMLSEISVLVEHPWQTTWQP